MILNWYTLNVSLLYGILNISHVPFVYKYVDSVHTPALYIPICTSTPRWVWMNGIRKGGWRHCCELSVMCCKSGGYGGGVVKVLAVAMEYKYIPLILIYKSIIKRQVFFVSHLCWVMCASQTVPGKNLTLSLFLHSDIMCCCYGVSKMLYCIWLSQPKYELWILMLMRIACGQNLLLYTDTWTYLHSDSYEFTIVMNEGWLPCLVIVPTVNDQSVNEIKMAAPRPHTYGSVDPFACRWEN